MKITLISSGGFLPLKKKASIDINWNEADIINLKKTAQLIESKDKNVRDGVIYQLQYEKESFSLDLQKVPMKYKQVLEDLKGRLVIEKF